MKLWKEYAIEPTLFANYHLGSQILAGLGFDQGRVVGAVPEKWQAAVMKASQNCRPLERSRIVDQLNRLKHVIFARYLVSDGDLLWREQAFKAHTRHPFDCILLHGRDPHPAAADVSSGLFGIQCWESDRRILTPRSAGNLALAMKPMLAAATAVVIVDSDFNPSEPLRRSRWLRPIQAIAACLARDGRVKRFEIHALDPREERRRWGAGVFTANCRANLGAALPPQITLDAMLWRERKEGLEFHERLIVTDLGGVVVDPGIDEGEQSERYTLRLISKQEIGEYLAKFARATAPYDLVDHQSVVGS
jgi:hypothetical protein